MKLIIISLFVIYILLSCCGRAFMFSQSFPSADWNDWLIELTFDPAWVSSCITRPCQPWLKNDDLLCSSPLFLFPLPFLNSTYRMFSPLLYCVFYIFPKYFLSFLEFFSSLWPLFFAFELWPHFLPCSSCVSREDATRTWWTKKRLLCLT